MKCFACTATLLLCLSQGATSQSTFGELPEGNAQTCTVDSDCPVINCFVAPCDKNVCNDAGVCELQPPDEMIAVGASARVEMSRQECTNEYDGIIVGDIGNGAIHSPDYVCESNGEAPLGTVIAGEGEPIASEGEVCCGAPKVEGVSRQECTNDGGIVVGDIGDGAIHSPDYKCESSGEAPIAKVVPGEGEPIAMEGEVCCGPAVMSMGECRENYNGVIVANIGSPDYKCESNGKPPIAKVVAGEGEHHDMEGPVCCGPAAGATTSTDAEPETSPPTSSPTPDSGATTAFQSLATSIAVAAMMFGHTIY